MLHVYNLSSPALLVAGVAGSTATVNISFYYYVLVKPFIKKEIIIIIKIPKPKPPAM